MSNARPKANSWTCLILISAIFSRVAPAADTSETNNEELVKERRKHWAYQPVRAVSVPKVKNAAWRVSDIDAFILAKLEEKGLEPCAPADRRTLIRRATFDLIGLPPTPEEADDFLRDRSSNAFAKVVDRLLASPHYGERWARHWLDLVRFSETLGFEFDFDLHYSWRYRDYVIRAFNLDLPYDQFVVEHLAGDLVPNPRRDPVEGFNESILATAFFWMGEGRQTPVDIRQEQADVIDGQIDVLSKAFLGQTVACARCHDHKFDAITTEDYYALAGYLKSSRYQQAFIDPPERITARVRQLAELRQQIRSLIAGEIAEGWIESAGQVSRYLIATQKAMHAAEGVGLKEIAQEVSLDEARLGRWVKALQQQEIKNPDHPLYAWIELATRIDQTADEFQKRRQTLLTDLRELDDEAIRAAAVTLVYENFQKPGLQGWSATGNAFGAGAAQPGDIIVGENSSRPVARFVSRGAHSGLLSRRLQGELRSETFTIAKPFVHFLMAGQRARLNLVIDGYTLIMNPMYGGLTISPTNDQPAWRTMAVDRWIGHRAHLEISDSTIPMNRLNPPPSTGRVPESPDDGCLSVNQICFSDERSPPPSPPNALNIEALDSPRCKNSEALANAYQELIVRELKRWKLGTMANRSEDGIGLLNWLVPNGLIDATSSRSERLAALLDQYRAIESNLPQPLRAPAIADGTGEDEFVFIRGNYRTPGKLVTRRPPEAIVATTFSPSPAEKEERAGERRPLETVSGLPTRESGRDGFPSVPDFTPPSGDISGTRWNASLPATGSGRLELARRLVDPSNPLIARVMVNRIWKHHFGEGIVRTPDDFGRMGQAPTHPELLDYLAGEFVRRDWSIKEMHRLMMNSAVYQQASRVISNQDSVISDPYSAGQIDSWLLNTDDSKRVAAIDPENRLLHHMPVRRLEAEAIRDAILAVSGRLDRTVHGPSVLPYLTPYMEGRGRPNSGPLDGDGRRSIYINARRNFPAPMLAAFDLPVHFSTQGRREVSTVPEQAMTLMNDPFVVQQAARWAERILAEAGKTDEQRVTSLYQAAFTRLPNETELRNARQFLEQQTARHGCGPDDPKPWADLCHVLINVKEFIFVN